MRSILSLALAAATAFAATVPAHAEDTLKLAIGQRGNRDTAVTELGQRASIFKKHGLVLKGIDQIVQEAVTLKYTSVPLTKAQQGELIQIPPRKK